MKAIILAGEGPRDGRGIRNSRADSLLSDKTTLLERQVNLLSLFGFSPEEILVKNLGVDQRNLILYGDLVLELPHLHALAGKSGNAVLTRTPIRLGEHSVRVKSANGQVTHISRSDPTLHFPWTNFAGAMILEGPLLAEFADSCRQGSFPEIIEWLGSNLDRHSCSEANIEAISTRPGVNRGGSDLVGGSFASLSTRRTVIKSASGAGREKVADEIKWIKNVPDTVKGFFPEVIAEGVTGDTVWFEMPHYPFENLRTQVLHGLKQPKEVVTTVDEILEMLELNIYSQDEVNAPPDWLVSKHISRVRERAERVADAKPHLRDFISAPVYEINGREVPNPLVLLEKMQERHSKLALLGPTKLRRVHGDLHFQNMLINPNDQQHPFILADPRGDGEGSDVFYDIGKLLHSCNGKYDLIHTDQQLLRETWGKVPSFELTFPNGHLAKKYDEIHRELRHALSRRFGSGGGLYDSLWEPKAYFAEAMHFSSLMIFHLKGDLLEHRAKALHLTGALLLSEFWDKFWDTL